MHFQLLIDQFKNELNKCKKNKILKRLKMNNKQKRKKKLSENADLQKKWKEKKKQEDEENTT